MDPTDEAERSRARGEFVAKVDGALRHGIAPWRTIWRVPAPRSLSGDSYYPGVNRLHLSLTMVDRQFSDPRFLTAGYAEKEGYALIENATSTPIYFSRYGAGRDGDAARKSVFPRSLFNAEEAKRVPAYQPTARSIDASDVVRRLVRGSGVHLSHSGSMDVPHYDVASDTIRIPARERFVDRRDYDATLLHELVHASGHGTREGRFATQRESDDLAIEELRAEIATIFLGQDLGISLWSGHAEEHDRHIAAWHGLLRDRPMRFLRCVHEAERIAAHVAGMDREVAMELGRATSAERLRAEKLPRSVLRAAERLVGETLQVIGPRQDYSEYVGPIVGEHEGFVFQQLNDRYVVVHRISFPDARSDRVWSIRYRDGDVSVSQDVRDSSRAATREEVAKLEQSLKETLTSRAWRAAYTRHNQYVGVLEHVGEQFSVQRTGRGVLVVHRTEDLGAGARLGARVRIRYRDEVAEIAPAPARRGLARREDASLGR